MKQPIVILFLLVFSSANAGNFTKQKSNHHAVRDTISPAGPNELYLNTAPVFVNLFGGQNYDSKYSLFYKREMKNPHWALRGGFSYKIRHYFNPFNYNISNSGAMIVNSDDPMIYTSDTTRIYSELTNLQQNIYQFNAGMEWRSKEFGRWNAFAFADVFYGFSQRGYKLRSMQQNLDKQIGEWETVPSSVEKSIYNSNGTILGITPGVGLRYAFSSHWMLSAQTAFEVSHFSGEVVQRDANGTGFSIHNNQYSDFNITSLLDEFDIVFRF